MEVLSIPREGIGQFICLFWSLTLWMGFFEYRGYPTILYNSNAGLITSWTIMFRVLVLPNWYTKNHCHVYVIDWFDHCTWRYLKWLKSIWWMPWCMEAMKDVVRCDKLRVGASNLWSEDFRMGKPTLRGILHWIHRCIKRTRRTETSKYPEEKKSTEIPLVAASEEGPALKSVLL